MIFHNGTVLSCVKKGINMEVEIEEEEAKYLKTMNTLDFLLEGLVYEAVLLNYRDPFKCLARNSNGVEGPTATYNENKK